MKTVKVKRAELLTILVKNRDTHYENVIDLNHERIDTIVAWMESELNNYKLADKKPSPKDFPEIPDNVSTYDRAIKMMELSVDEEIELSEHEFDQYVMDNWSFNHDLLRTATFYGKGLK